MWLGGIGADLELFIAAPFVSCTCFCVLNLAEKRQTLAVCAKNN